MGFTKQNLRQEVVCKLIIWKVITGSRNEVVGKVRQVGEKSQYRVY